MALRKRERDGNPRRYTFKLYPTPEQHETLLRQCAMVGALWNALLELQEQQYRRVRGQRGVTHAVDVRPYLSHFDMSAMVKPLREAFPEWAEMSTWTAHRVAYAMSKAFESFFSRAKKGAGASAGYPRYKSYQRGEQNWLPHRFASGCKLVHVQGNTWSLILKGVHGAIHARGKLPAPPNAWTDADIRYQAGTWWLSVAVDMNPRISPEIDGTTSVSLDCIDCFAEVDGKRIYAFDLGIFDDARIGQIQQRMSEMDRRSDEYAQLRREKARRQARQARRRREKLHEWTTSLVRGASRIELVIPSAVKEQTKSGRGDRKEWGAAVEAKAALNRQVLSLAPAMAIQMIRYKAKEAGVELVETKSDHLEVGNHLVAATKAVRKLKSIITEARNNE